jgi:hypothetical protein
MILKIMHYVQILYAPFRGISGGYVCLFCCTQARYSCYGSRGSRCGASTAAEVIRAAVETRGGGVVRVLP